ncbi:hypothetical protein ACPX3P_000725 [Yersinia enterocolitica]|uniref:hypothetical protein n=1 Tax=Yersinia enterocolitica TaxID=630 RepID=UPI003312AE42|nr:hypothetical protein [Yersinia enterocolitica]
MESSTDKTQENTVEQVMARKVKDADLIYLVRMANIGYGLGVTLLTKGTMISGTLTSGKDYYETVASKISDAGEFGVALAKYYTDKIGEYTPSDDEDKEIPLTFLHLKDFSILKGDGGFFNLKGATLRLKIEEIDGHLVGVAS